VSELKENVAVEVIDRRDARFGQVGVIVWIERGKISESLAIAFDDGEDEGFAPSQVRVWEDKQCKTSK
jgi:hypothetical protein